MAELETDVQHLQGELERQQAQLREADRDKTKAISELSEQNHRLLEQLSRVRSSLSQGFFSSALCVQELCRTAGFHGALRDPSAQVTLVT